MIIDRTILFGQVRDSLYREVLQSDTEGNLLHPELAEDAIDSLHNLAFAFPTDVEIVSMAASLTCFIGWHLNKHENPANRGAMLLLLNDILDNTPNDPALITMTVLMNNLDPKEVRAAEGSPFQTL